LSLHTADRRPSIARACAAHGICATPCPSPSFLESSAIPKPGRGSGNYRPKRDRPRQRHAASISTVQYLGSERKIPCALALALALRRALRHGDHGQPPSTSPHSHGLPDASYLPIHSGAPRRPSLLLAACGLQHHRRTTLPKTAHPRITLGITFPCVRADEMSDEDGPANPRPLIQPTKSLEASKLNQP
jgi:hypothetical protein